MTRYLHRAWDLADSSPLEDIQAAKKLMGQRLEDIQAAKKAIDLRELTEDELRGLGEKHLAETGLWPAYAVGARGVLQTIPPRASLRSRSSGRP